MIPELGAHLCQYKLKIAVASSKQSFIYFVQLLEDSLQMHRLQYVIDGREGDMRDEHVQGMLGECCCLAHNLSSHCLLEALTWSCSIYSLSPSMQF